ncbi:MAG: type II toxin-antitoxin system Phd/YefM family antitoxin [Deltaproteobacteria bacterium]|nr:type II toxin-antitoxin system Phd/YefM family antitoxin [Deltaproteobacteria bacterium]
MNKININEAKTNLSRYLKRIRNGETIILCRRNVPIAEIRRLPDETSDRPRIGLCRGSFTVPPEFFAPLPEDVLATFEGADAGTGPAKADR